MRVAPDRLLVGVEVAAAVVGGVSLAAVGYWIAWPLLLRLPTVASLIVAAAALGLLFRLALELPAAIRSFRAWHTRKAADLLASATRRLWATTTDLATTDNGHDPTL